MENYFFRLPQEQRFQDLRLIFCGREACVPLHRWGPAVRPNYIIHYILKGKGIFQVGNDTWEIHEKEGFLIEPEVQTFYQADKDQPWEYCWIGFDGVLAPVLLRELGLGDHRLTFRCEKKEELTKIFQQILQYQQLSAENELLQESLLYYFFALLMKDSHVPEKVNKGNRSYYVQEAIRFIRDNYYTPIKVADIAAYVGIDRSYLYTLFMKELGMKPSDYLATFRLTRAAEMLKLTSYSIESVAYSCGYQDPLVFAKAFKQKYGLPPLKFRQLEMNRSD